MDISRRKIIRASIIVTAISLLLKPALVLAEWNKKAFSATTQKDALDKFFPGNSIEASDKIKIIVHDLVENGAVVPLKIKSDIKAQSITILVEKNPNPLIASFNMAQECSSYIETRIKVGQPSDITVIVKSDGKLYSAKKFVDVVEGGCG